MKLVTFITSDEARPRIGAVDPEGHVVELPAGEDPAFASMLALIEAGPAALDRARSAETARMTVHEDARLLAPVPEPRQMRDALSFEKHLRQARANRHLFGNTPKLDWQSVELPQVWYDQPVYYKANRFSVVGPNADVPIPFGEPMFDYELEFGIFLGKGGRDIPRESAMDHVFGFCIFNDFSARTAQIREMAGQLGPAKGKDFDAGNAMGPWLVTADEVDPGDLTMVARVNGEEWSRGNSGTMHHDFARIIEHVSLGETLHWGEFIGSGTVGDGCGLELEKFLKAGDVVELEITGLGILRNTVVEGTGRTMA